MSGERLVVLVNGNGAPELRSEGGRRVATLRHGQHKDARRLADCWNAARGLSQDSLEFLQLFEDDQGGLQTPSSAHAKLMADYAALRDRHAALRNCLEASEVANEALKRDLAAAYVSYEALHAARAVAWYKPWTWRASR